MKRFDIVDLEYTVLTDREKEIKRLKEGIKHYQRGMFKIISVATECKNNKEWNYKG